MLELIFGIPDCFTLSGYCTMTDRVSSRDPPDLKKRNLNFKDGLVVLCIENVSVGRS